MSKTVLQSSFMSAAWKLTHECPEVSECTGKLYFNIPWALRLYPLIAHKSYANAATQLKVKLGVIFPYIPCSYADKEER